MVGWTIPFPQLSLQGMGGSTQICTHKITDAVHVDLHCRIGSEERVRYRWLQHHQSCPSQDPITPTPPCPPPPCFASYSPLFCPSATPSFLTQALTLIDKWQEKQDYFDVLYKERVSSQQGATIFDGHSMSLMPFCPMTV